MVKMNSCPGRSARSCDERQRHVSAVRKIGLEILEHFLAALARVDAAAIQHERSVDAVAPSEGVRLAFDVGRQRLAARRRQSRARWARCASRGMKPIHDIIF